MEIEAEVIPLTKEELEAQALADFEREYAQTTLNRHAAYTAPGGSDAVFMKYQRDEATKEEWLAAKAAIDEANPYPPAPKAKKAK